MVEAGTSSHGLKEIEGSVCAPRGFRAGVVPAGIKPSGNPDVTLLASDFPATAAGLFTTNQVCAAPVTVSREHLADGAARAVAVNSGCANAVTGEQGMRDARSMAALAAETLGLAPSEVLVASTGVIGRFLPMDRLAEGLRRAAAELSAEGGPAAARAIMTTDTRPKEIAVEFLVEGRPVRIGGICKGSGMIAPNMATMLAFVTTDAGISADLLQAELRDAVDRTINCVTVDGDTSTNDSIFVLANGASGVRVEQGTPALEAFRAGLLHVCRHLGRELARDGEGATKLVEIRVTGANSEADARQVARSIANSPLVKTALFGNDPNWGRVLMAAGRAGVAFDATRLSLEICGHPLVRSGEPVAFQEAVVGAAMKAGGVDVHLDLGQGDAQGFYWTCDFSYDYVRINAEYTT